MMCKKLFSVSLIMISMKNTLLHTLILLSLQNARHNSISFCRQCRKLLTTPGLVKKLKDEHFDAIITENFENCGVGERILSFI